MFAVELAPKTIPAGEGRRVRVLGDTILFKLTGEDTNGAFMLFENRNKPGRGVAAHTHRREDETLYLLEGEVELQIGDETITARAGETAFLPRDIPHSWRVVGSSPAHMLIMVSPAGFEDYIVEMSYLDADAQPQDILTVSARYGIEFLPPAR